jgi:hypothetical protein
VIAAIFVLVFVGLNQHCGERKTSPIETEQISTASVTGVEPSVQIEPVSDEEPTIETVEPQPIEIVEPTLPISDIITEKSGLTAEELEALVAGTELEGLGYPFYQMEQEYLVNAVFALSVAQLESGYGTSRMAREDNNIFGMMGRVYQHKEENVGAFGELIKYHYFGRGLTTLESINTVYCPNSYEWAPQVRSLMNRNFARIGR